MNLQVHLRDIAADPARGVAACSQREAHMTRILLLAMFATLVGTSFGATTASAASCTYGFFDHNNALVGKSTGYAFKKKGACRNARISCRAKWQWAFNKGKLGRGSTHCFRFD